MLCEAKAFIDLQFSEAEWKAPGRIEQREISEAVRQESNNLYEPMFVGRPVTPEWTDCEPCGLVLRDGCWGAKQHSKSRPANSRTLAFTGLCNGHHSGSTFSGLGVSLVLSARKWW